MPETEWIIENTDLRLKLRVVSEIVEAEFRDKESGRIFAKGPYLYRVERKAEEGRFVTDSLLSPKIQIVNKRRTEKVLQIKGQVGKLEIIHQFSNTYGKPFLDESFIFRNCGKTSIRIKNVRFGFTRLVVDNVGTVDPELKEDRFVAVPDRRHTLGRNGEYQDYSISDIMFNRGRYRNLNTQMYFGNDVSLPAESFGAEGWVWSLGNRSLLILNYSQEHIEFSTIGIDYRDDGVVLVFGGCERWHQDPESLEEISPQKRLILGQNRYQLVNGGFRDGYYAFRHFMEEHGHSAKENFDPPVHWNELYDNPLWWINAGSKRYRSMYYCLGDMEKEAFKAKEIGCESLYLDPGWDTNLASTIWDEQRLGTIKDFVNLMRNKYNLGVSLHCPLAGWSDPSTYPSDANRMDVTGKRIEGKLCSGAKQYLDEKAKRLLKLCEAGVGFLMFDGAFYTGPCFDKNHGHSVPYTREAHCRSYLQLARKVHTKFPDVLIEMHNMIDDGFHLRHCPTYYLHGLPRSFDENWGFEYMWDPMEDLLSGGAISLYYYNLAHSLPLYLHIDLRMDNVHCLEFWWYASTCRHLGVGGKHADPIVWEAHKVAMQRYLRLKEFYTQGIFYGFGEDVHVHVLPKKQAAVVNLFNLTDQEIIRKESFCLEDIGILPDVPLIIEDARSGVKDSLFKFTRRMPPHSAAVIEIWPARKER